MNQTSLVEKVDELLRKPDGDPYFTTTGGKEFNPASGAFYTFNAALKAWSDEEEK